MNTPTQDDKAQEKKSCCKWSGDEIFQGVIWWSMLLVAVLAIPAFAVAVTVALPFGETAQLFVFMITCWVCTWIGMWLMKKAKEK